MFDLTAELILRFMDDDTRTEYMYYGGQKMLAEWRWGHDMETRESLDGLNVLVDDLTKRGMIFPYQKRIKNEDGTITHEYWVRKRATKFKGY